MSVSAIVVRGYGNWSAVRYLPTFGYRTSPFVDPSNCPITTAVTMPANAISGDVTMAANSITAGITMPANSATTGIGMGCGQQN